MKHQPSLGPVMFDIQGLELAPEECEKIRHPATGGIILFSRNYHSVSQVTDLIASIRAVNPALLIAVDQEGGRVQRFKEGFKRLPAAANYRKFYSGDPQGLQALLETAGWLMAAELRALDVDFSFAPVLDVDCGISEIIGDRSFSQDAAEVAVFAEAFSRGMKKAGMASVGKHFPGHGAVALDSHLTLPEDERALDEILAKDLQPFKALIAAGLEGIMPAHVVYPKIDDKPAGFSKTWISEILRAQLGFDGLVFSDDLSMEGAAIAGSYEARARLALDAGCDMVLVCNQPDAAWLVLDALKDEASATHQYRFKAMQGGFRIDRDALMKSVDWKVASDKLDQFIMNCNPQ